MDRLLRPSKLGVRSFSKNNFLCYNEFMPLTTLPGLEEYSTPSLSPMFSYFGSKYMLSGKYSQPKHDVIIEPFAGSAGYALQYSNKKVKLYDLDEKVCAVWDYLIHVSEAEVMSLPLGPFTVDNPVTVANISQAAQYLIGYWIVESQTVPSKRAYNRGGSWTELTRARLASQLQYIRHWTIEQKTYQLIDNERATWFVDPPYQISGTRYRCSSKKIDYAALADWCKERVGQVIACEGFPKGSPAPTWLPFKQLGTFLNASNDVYGELVWEN
jgi:hypothetical protein